MALVLCWKDDFSIFSGQSESQSRTSNLINTRWDRLFQIEEVTHVELTNEFMSTFHYNANVNDLKRRKCIRFRLARQCYEMTLAEIGVTFGFYTLEETRQAVFLEAKRWFVDDEAAEFWGRVGSGPYIPKSIKSTAPRDPLDHYLHRVLVSTLCTRSKAPENATDTFHLHCLIEQVHCNMAHVMADYFQRVVNGARTSPVCGGRFVTYLAGRLGVSPQILSTCTSFPSNNQTLGIGTMRKLKIVQLSRYGLLDNNEEPWVKGEVDDEEEEEEFLGGDAGGNEKGACFGPYDAATPANAPRAVSPASASTPAQIDVLPVSAGPALLQL
ncbi:hypothetical protein L1987_30251 [Smallanthus sonchifolius]|uniref:Uncharacterized protein n=1 Tax=Smallanthus sonchifolius TaxID=185202 RepID=A0ACB9I2A5_9ASTR|nr:hypothetical protein L1987_30251 [Smallanthus sonchifolius]